MPSYEEKEPGEIVDYAIDWTLPLGGDAIDLSVWEVSPSGLGLDANPPTFDRDSTRIWLSGGTAGTRYTITNTVTTHGGRVFRQCFYCDVA